MKIHDDHKCKIMTRSAALEWMLIELQLSVETKSTIIGVGLQVLGRRCKSAEIEGVTSFD